MNPWSKIFFGKKNKNKKKQQHFLKLHFWLQKSKLLIWKILFYNEIIFLDLRSWSFIKFYHFIKFSSYVEPFLDFWQPWKCTKTPNEQRVPPPFSVHVEGGWILVNSFKGTICFDQFDVFSFTYMFKFHANLFTYVYTYDLLGVRINFWCLYVHVYIHKCCIIIVLFYIIYPSQLFSVEKPPGGTVLAPSGVLGGSEGVAHGTKNVLGSLSPTISEPNHS